MRNRKHIKGDTAELIAAQYFIDRDWETDILVTSE